MPVIRLNVSSIRIFHYIIVIFYIFKISPSFILFYSNIPPPCLFSSLHSKARGRIRERVTESFRTARKRRVVSILTLYHRLRPWRCNKPSEFTGELWERRCKHKTQEYPMYSPAYCTRRPWGFIVLEVGDGRTE